MTLPNNIESSGEDPMVFIREEVKGYHISRDHRYWVKQAYGRENHENVLQKPYWNLTLSQIYIGLRSDQAR